MENENKLPEFPIGIDAVQELQKILEEELNEVFKKAKHRIKTPNFNMAFELIEDNNLSTYKLLKQWCDLIEEQKIQASEPQEDSWTTLPGLPQYSFQNLEIVNNPDTIENISDFSIILKCDSFEPIKDNL